MPSRPTRTRPAWAGGGRIRDVHDVQRLFEGVQAAGLDRANTATARHLVQPAHEAELAPDASRILPIVDELSALMPWPGGIRRGATVALTGGMSLVMTMLAAPMKQGSWAAVVGLPEFGALAAHTNFGLPLDRLAMVPNPGPDWPSVVAALLDGLDIVVVGASDAADSTVRALMNRARQRNSVLLTTIAWAGSDLTIDVTDRRWTGLGQGHGRLRRQEVALRSVGRGRAARPSTVATLLPPPSVAAPEVDPRDVPIPTPLEDDGQQDAERPAEIGDVGRPRLTVVPNEVPPPVDPWGDLAHQVPPVERKRRR